uniref:Transmembrane protein n=1 Tax=Fagus sylvatica TaxID=28930 RepID=A0A2N9H4C6_FAGSY
MNFRNTSTLLIIFIIFVTILSHAEVEASRVLSEDFGNANHIETHSPIYEKAKDIMAYWLQRLPSGPSPGGAGH